MRINFSAQFIQILVHCLNLIVICHLSLFHWIHMIDCPTNPSKIRVYLCTRDSRRVIVQMNRN